MRRYRMLWGIVALVALLYIPSAQAQGNKKIAMLIWSDEGRYAKAAKGVFDQLKKDGLKEPNVQFVVENAQGNKAKAAQAVQKFTALRPDLILTVGTTATIAVSREVKDIPIVFSMVYDPVEVKVAKEWRSSGNNTTGASPRVPMEKLVAAVSELTPLKRLAVIYTPGEKNSEAQLKELQGLQGSQHFSVLPVPLTRKEEIPQLLPNVVRTVDAIFLSGSSLVGSEVSAIVSAAQKGKVVTVTHLDDLVEKGVLLGVCADPYQVGRLAGEKAVKVLRGAEPSAIPIEHLKKINVILNGSTAKAGHYHLAPAVMAKVTKVLQ